MCVCPRPCDYTAVMRQPLRQNIGTAPCRREEKAGRSSALLGSSASGLQRLVSFLPRAVSTSEQHGTKARPDGNALHGFRKRQPQQM